MFGIHQTEEILLLKTPEIIPAQQRSVWTSFQSESSLEPDAERPGPSPAPQSPEQWPDSSPAAEQTDSDDGGHVRPLYLPEMLNSDRCRPAEEAAKARAEPSWVTELRGLVKQGEMSAEEKLKGGC